MSLESILQARKKSDAQLRRSGADHRVADTWDGIDANMRMAVNAAIALGISAATIASLFLLRGGKNVSTKERRAYKESV